MGHYDTARAWVARHPLLSLFVASLVVRIVVWTWVTKCGVPPVLDECSYLDRAKAWVSCLHALAVGTLPDSALWDDLYGRGVWPPLHPACLSLGLWIGGVPGARLVVVLASALTTPLLFALARRCGFRPRIAVGAALLHAIYPEFVAFSHYLWSESVFTAFVVASLLAVLRSQHAPSVRGAIGWAIMAGICLGAAALCRASVLLLVPVVVLWSLVTMRNALGRALIRMAFLCGAFVLVIAPWLIALRWHEGRWMPLATSGGFNLFLGNNTRIPPDLGSTWGLPSADLRQPMDRIMVRQQDVMEEEATLRQQEEALMNVFAQDSMWRRQAVDSMRADPQGALRHAVLRLEMLCGPDIFFVRHALNACYPPFPVPVLALLWFVAWGLFACVLIGFCVALWQRAPPPCQWFLLVIALALAAPAVFSISNSRMRFTSTVLVLPMATAGLVALRYQLFRLKHLPRARLVAGVLTLVLMALLSILAANTSAKYYFCPSSFYSGLVRPLSLISSLPPMVYDTVSFTTSDRTSKTLRVELLSAEPGDAGGARLGTSVLFDMPAGRAVMRLASHAKGPTVVRISEMSTGQQVVLPIADRHAWRQDLPTGLPGLNYSVNGCTFLWK